MFALSNANMLIFGFIYEFNSVELNKYMLNIYNVQKLGQILQNIEIGNYNKYEI